MAKQKNTAAPSQFWHPEVAGDAIEGKFLSWHETQYGLAMKLEKEGGAIGMVGMSTVLFNLLKENLKAVRKGVTIKLVYEGKKKRAKIFSAFVNGKHLDSSMSFPEASAAAVNDFFAKEYEYMKEGKKSRKGKK